MSNAPNDARVGSQQEKPKSGKILLFVIAAVVVLMIIALIVGVLPRLESKRETEQLAAEHKNDKPIVEVMKVERAKAGNVLIVPGTTTPLLQSAVYARAGGYLKRRYVDLGDHVRKGQLLAIIDAPDLDAQVDQARHQLSQSEAQLEQQKAQLNLSKVTNDRYQALVARGVISRQEGDQQQTNYQAQVANVAAAQRNVEAFKANLDRVIALQGYERVTAPFDGVVTARNVDTGDLITAGGSSGGTAPNTLATQNTSGSQGGASNSAGTTGNAPTAATPSSGAGNGGALFTIAQSGRLRIYTSVPEAYAGLIHVGDKATLSVQEHPEEKFPADVMRTAGAIDQNTRTMLVELQVDNSKGLLMPGMYTTATFPAPKVPGLLMISGDAIAIRNDKPTVAVVQDGTVRLAPVVIGRDLGSAVEIIAGLKEGDLIAMSFSDEIREGTKVTTRMSAQQKSAASGTSGTQK